MANIVISDTFAQRLQNYAEMNSVSIETVIAQCLDRQASETSDAKYWNLIASSPAATFISRSDKDGELRFVYSNGAAIALVGTKSERDLVGKRFLDFISPQENEKLSQRTQQYESDKSLFTTEYHIRCLDGTSKYVRVSSIKIDYDGSPALMSVMTDITEQHEAETALRQDRNLLRTLLDNLPYEVYVKDHESRFVMANRATLKIWKKDTLDELIGRTDFDSGPDSDPVMSQFYYDQEQRIFETGQPVINHEVEPSGNDERYLSINKYPVFDVKGDITQIVCINFDVTKFKNTEQALREKEETASAFQRYLHNLHKITLELSQTETLDHLYRRVIELGREKLGFDRLGLWIIDREQGLLHGTYGTDEEGNLRIEYDIVRPLVVEMTAFEIIHKKERITIRQDVILRDNDNQPIGKGWHAVAILWNGKEGIGWLSADNYLSHAPLRPYESDLLSTYGTAIGHLITQKKVGDALRASEETARSFQEYLRALHHITLELSQIEAIDDFYRRVVELGREKLGFDRLGLWLFMPDRKSVYGTFGTDEVGNLRDERGTIHSIEDESVALGILHKKEHVVFAEGNVIRDNQLNIVGDGWSALAILWNGSEGIGWLATDNLLSQLPPRPYEEDLLSTYSNVVGHLLSRKRAEGVVRRSEENALAFQEKLRTLHDIILELSQIKTIDDFYQSAIELGRNRLSFNRLSLWRVSETDQIVSGTFGTDEDGYLRDERHIVLPLSESESGLLDILRSKGRVYIREKGDIRNEKQQVIGNGWRAVAVIWDGVEGIGWLSADNYLNRAEPRSYEFDLLIIYANALGNLIAQREAHERLQRYNQRLSILHRIDKGVLSAQSPQEIADTVLEQLAQLIPCEFLSVILHNDDLTEERIFALRHTAELGPYSQEIQPVVQNEVLETLKSGKTAVAQDLLQQTGSHARLALELESRGVRSALASPMIVHGKLIGTIALAALEVGFFTSEHQQITEEVATQIAIALHQAKLNDQIRQYNTELEQRVRERTMQLEHANRELEMFSYSVSHDLRAPLRAIQGFAEIIARRHRDSLNEEGRRYFDHIVTAAEQMDQLISDLLNYARLGRQQLHLETIPLKFILDTVLDNLQPLIDNVSAQIRLQNELPIIQGDRTLLIQIFTNLLHNALTYHRSGVTPVINVSWHLDDGQATICIRDNGIGIPSEFHEKVFDIFQRLHGQEQYPGTGIGLAIVRRSVDLLNGRVWIKTVTEGSLFCVSFPHQVEQRKMT